MHILCPHCQSPIEVVQLPASREILCASCGSTFRLEGGSTTTATLPDGMRQLDHFELIAPVGSGAFGTVFKARDTRLDRLVALKIPRAGNLPDGQELDRFVREARTAAQLSHPAIVAIHEVGQTGSGLSYLVSDFIDGVTLSDRLTAGRPPLRESVQIIAALAEALDHAHRHGIIHRDIKPSNIMLHADGSPVIMDFGLAKRDAGEVTMTIDGQVLGTPAYMSPEQARGEGHRVDGRSDLYSLGVIFYLLLTGGLPFRGNSRMLLHQVIHEEPRPPRRINDKIPRDLETVCLKAMAKEPQRRYASGRELAADLRRWLAGEPIQARPVGTLEWAWRWAGRNPAAAGLLAASAVAVLALVAAAVGFAFNRRLEQAYQAEARSRQMAEEQRRIAVREGRRAEEQRDAADRARRDAEGALQLANTYAAFHRTALADKALQENDPLRAELLLDASPPDQRNWEWFYLKRQCHVDLMTISTGPAGAATRVALSPDGRRAARSGTDGLVQLWDLETGERVWMSQARTPPSVVVAYDPQGRLIATGHEDATIRTWDAATGRSLAVLRGHAAPIPGLAFRPDGRSLVSASQDGSIGIWDLASGRPRRMLKGHRRSVIQVAFAADGRTLASVSWDGTARLWEPDDGRVLRSVPGQEGSLTAVGLSPDARILATGGLQGDVRIWEVASGRLLHKLAGHTFTVQALAFSPDGGLLASCSSDGTIRTWRVATGQSDAIFRGHHGHVFNVAFHPEGDRLVSSGIDGTIKVWDALSTPDAFHVQAQGAITEADFVFAPDGRRLITMGLDQALEVRDADSGEILRTIWNMQNVPTLQGSRGVAISHDGRYLAFGAWRQPLRVHDLADDRELRLWRDRRYTGGSAFAPDGRRLAAACEDGTVAILDLATGLSIRSLAGHSNPVEDVAFAADGRRLASSGGDGMTVIWDVESGRKLHVLRGDGGVTRVRFSPDDRLIATAGKDSTVRLWDAGTGRELRALKGHTGTVYGLGFNPDGRRLATCGMDRSVKLWDVATGQELLTLRGTHNQTTGVSFDPDGHRLAAIDTKQHVVIWDVSPFSPEEQGRRRDRILQQRGSRYLRAAAQAMASREWTDALWFLDRMPTESGPARARALAARGEVLGQLGRFAESARAFQQLCALPGAAAGTWGRWALVSYGAGDLAGCRSAVTTLLDRFGTDPSPQLANEVAWASVRFPDCMAKPDPERALRLAQRAVDQGRAAGPPRMSGDRVANLLNTLGAAHYRSGDAASAVARLDEAIRVRDGRGMWADWLFLAMAHHKLGHLQEARHFFDRAMRWWTEEHRGGADCPGWSEHLEFQLIRREAESLLRDPSTELPADVFAP